jgi:CheY-like chemotaxis protein
VVRLPMAPEERASQEPERHVPDHPPLNQSPALRLLVVDDHQECANSLGRLLKSVGHEVRVAYDGPAALEAARALEPHAVLQDIRMPDMNGYELARCLRAQSTTRHMLLVALTGYGSDEDRRRSCEAGFDHHLVKPVDLASLQALLASIDG